MRTLRHRRTTPLRAEGEESGFTLVELVIAVGLAGFMFAVLANTLGHSLKVLAVSKSRSHGNEVATQGIEELQRLAYPALGVCESAPTPPAGFSERAAPLNCPTPVPVNYGEDPCSVTTAGAGVPKAVYTCTRLNIPYTVRRYVAWGDPGRTTKRMAVFVNWTDALGRHEVSQQSSLRAPGQADLYGVEPPGFTGPVSVSPNTTVINGDGTLPAGTTVTVTTTTVNLTTADRVFAVFPTLDVDNNQIVSSKALTSGDGSSWSGTISSADGFRFAPGTLFVNVSAIRADDGKANTAFAPTANKFCAPPDVTCSSSNLPRFESVDALPSSGGPAIGVDSAGTLLPDAVTLTASTRNTTPLDQVTVSFQTSAGAVTVLMQSTSPTCDATTSCTWSGLITKASGYGFPSGSRPFYFAVSQAGGGPTGALATPDKVFELR